MTRLRLVGALVTAAVALSVAAAYFLWPRACPFAAESVKRVNLGMTRSEVEAILGPPGEYATGPLLYKPEPQPGDCYMLYLHDLTELIDSPKEYFTNSPVPGLLAENHVETACWSSDDLVFVVGYWNDTAWQSSIYRTRRANAWESVYWRAKRLWRQWFDK